MYHFEASIDQKLILKLALLTFTSVFSDPLISFFPLGLNHSDFGKVEMKCFQLNTFTKEPRYFG